MNISPGLRHNKNRYQARNDTYKTSIEAHQPQSQSIQSSSTQNFPTTQQPKRSFESKLYSHIPKDSANLEKMPADLFLFKRIYSRLADSSHKPAAQLPSKKEQPIRDFEPEANPIKIRPWFVMADKTNKVPPSEDPKPTSFQKYSIMTRDSKDIKPTQIPNPSQIGGARSVRPQSAKLMPKTSIQGTTTTSTASSRTNNSAKTTLTTRSNQAVRTTARPATSKSSNLTSQLQARNSDKSKTKPVPEEPSDYNPDECQICLMPLFGENSAQEIAILDCCGHIFHKPCLVPYLSDAIDNWKFPIKCAHVRCKKEILSSNLKELLPRETYEKFEDVSLKFYLRQLNDKVARCLTSNCPYAIELDRANQIKVLKCPLCKGSYCLKCEEPSHEPLTCGEKKEMQNEDPVVVEFVKGRQLRRCTACKFWIEKIEGCNHMTCRCRNEFCYLCGVKWKQCDC